MTAVHAGLASGNLWNAAAFLLLEDPADAGHRAEPIPLAQRLIDRDLDHPESSFGVTQRARHCLNLANTLGSTLAAASRPPQSAPGIPGIATS